MTYTNVVIAGSLTGTFQLTEIVVLGNSTRKCFLSSSLSLYLLVGKAFVQTEIALHMATVTPPSLGISYTQSIPGYCSLVWYV